MSGMFPSSGPIRFTFMQPNTLQTNVAGGDITMNAVLNDPTHAKIAIYDPSGTLLVHDVLSALGGDFSVAWDATYIGQIKPITVQYAPASPLAEGRYCASLINDTVSYASQIPQIDYCDVGGLADLLAAGATAASKGYTSRAINLQDSYESTGVSPTRLFAPFADPATGLPETTGLPAATAQIIPLATFNARTATVAWQAGPDVWTVDPNGALGPDAGPWLLILTQVIGGVTQTQYDWFWWGDGVPVQAVTQATLAKAAALAAATAAGNAETQASLANAHAVDAKNEATDARIASQAGLALQRGNNTFDPATGILHVYNETGFPELIKWQCYQDIGMTTPSTSPSNILVSVKI